MKTKILNTVKKVALLLTILAGAYNLSAQVPIQNIEIDWQTCFDNDLPEPNQVSFYPNNILAVEDGYLILMEQGSPYIDKLWLIKTDVKGKEQWSKVIHEDYYGEKMTSLLPSEKPDSYYIISPLHKEHPLNECSGVQSIFVTKIDDKGAVLWNKSFCKNTNLFLYGSFSMDDGIVLMLMGYNGNNPANYNSCHIVKLNHEGYLLWELTLPEQDFSVRHPFSTGFIKTSDGGILLSGIEKNKKKTCIIKLNAQGEQEWQQRYGSDIENTGTGSEPRYSYICNFIETENGYVAVGASNAIDGDLTGLNYHEGSNEIEQPASDVWVLKLDFSGNIIWHQLYGGSRPDIGFHIFETSDKNLLGFAYTKSTDGDIKSIFEDDYWSAAWIFLLDTNNGSLLSQRVILNSNKDQELLINNGKNVIQIADETYVMAVSYNFQGGDFVCGQEHHINFENYRYLGWLAQITLKEGGDIDGIDEHNTLQATVYPNPATDYVLIECTEYEKAEFVVYDVVGRVLHRQLLNSEKSYVNTSVLKNGVYVYQIQSNDKKNIGKMVITH